jgi:tetratricopeptide (TPR) repeat protein
MGYIERLGEKDVEYFGGNRILGWAYFKLPFPLGDKSKALELLEEACDQTLDSNGNISIHSTNVVYYAQILAAKGKEAKAKDILKKFIKVGSSEESLREYNEDRIPETLEEIEEAKKILERL